MPQPQISAEVEGRRNAVDAVRHTHPCGHCKTPVECEGGQLETLHGPHCPTYHTERGVFLCESCDRLFHLSECYLPECNQPGVMPIDDCDDGSGYRGEVFVCQSHYDARKVQW